MVGRTVRTADQSVADTVECCTEVDCLVGRAETAAGQAGKADLVEDAKNKKHFTHFIYKIRKLICLLD